MFLDRFISDNLPFPLTLLPDDCYLVGGSVRDVLLSRQRQHIDFDFVVYDSAISIAKKIANTYKGGFVVLDADRHIARVVFSGVTVDIANAEGNSIDDDLTRRDYTINAIAYHCHNQEIIDPFCGQEDLKMGKIRMISPKNLADDPLRLLRAYRQGCQLNFHIEEETRDTIKQLVPLLSKVAVERVNSELYYLLIEEKGTYWLTQIFEDGLLSVYHPHLNHTKISYLHCIDRSAQWLKTTFPIFVDIHPEYYYIAKLACFTSDNPPDAEKELINLKYSRQVIKTVSTILKYTPYLLESNFSTNLANQYFFFRGVGDIFPVLAIFAHAHHIDTDLLTMLIHRYLDVNDKVAHSQPLLTGKEIMDYLSIPPSPLIGKLLTDIQIAYIEGKINDRQSALEYLNSR